MGQEAKPTKGYHPGDILTLRTENPSTPHEGEPIVPQTHAKTRVFFYTLIRKQHHQKHIPETKKSI